MSSCGITASRICSGLHYSHATALTSSMVRDVVSVRGRTGYILIDRLFLLFADRRKHKNWLESVRWLFADERGECEWGPKKKEEG